VQTKKGSEPVECGAKTLPMYSTALLTTLAHEHGFLCYLYSVHLRTYIITVTGPAVLAVGGGGTAGWGGVGGAGNC